MRQFKKISKLALATAACSMALLFAAPSLTIPVNAASSDTETVSPQADVKRWIYEKREDGWWKRLYNTSLGIWEGDWIYVGPIINP